MLDKCKQVGKDSVKLLTAWQTGIKINDCSEGLKITVDDVESMASLTQANESLGDLVEDELSIMDRAIEEAAKRIQVWIKNLNINIFFCNKHFIILFLILGNDH